MCRAEERKGNGGREVLLLLHVLLINVHVHTVYHTTCIMYMYMHVEGESCTCVHTATKPLHC